MCKEEIIPSRVKFFARALNIRAPDINVIGAPLREEVEDDGGNANDILFTAIVNDLHNSETSRLTQQDIRDLQEFDMLPGMFIGDDREQREVEFQVAEWAEAVGSDRDRSAEVPGYEGEDEGEDLEDEENERTEDEDAAAEEPSGMTSPRITPPERESAPESLEEPDESNERLREYISLWSRAENSEATARPTQTRQTEVRVQLPPVLPTTLDPPRPAGEVPDAQTRAGSSTPNILPNEFALQLPASIYDPTTLATEIEPNRAELSAIIALEFQEVREEVGRTRRQRLRGDGHRGVRQPEMRERYSYEGPDALYRHWPPISPPAVHDSDAEMNDNAGLSRIPEEEDDEVVSEDGSGSRSTVEDEQTSQVDEGEETASIADAFTISIAMAIAITVAVAIAVAIITIISLLLFHRRWRRRR